MSIRRRYGETESTNITDQIVTQYEASCALKSDSTVWCWGRNHRGQLGDTTTAQKTAPVQVQGLPGTVTAIAAGSEHACALAGGAVYCWGYGSSGQQGQGDTSNRTTATLVPGLSGVDSLHLGGYNTCVLRSGEALCWGESMVSFGTGNPTELSPVSIPGLDSGVTDVLIEDFNGCAIKNGEVYCWGWGAFALVPGVSLGDGTSNPSDIPVAVVGLSTGVKKLAVGGASVCALLEDKTVQCWGANMQGGLGDGGLSVGSNVPVAVPGIADAVDLIQSNGAFCVLRENSEVSCWGDNYYGQIGNGDLGNDAYSPVTVAGLTDVVEIVSAAGAVCARLVNGTVKCWGWGDQLGDGDLTAADKDTPVTTVLPLPAIRIYEGACARLSDQSIYCWGNNYDGDVSLDDSTQLVTTPILYPWRNAEIAEVQGSVIKTNDGKFHLRSALFGISSDDMSFSGLKMDYSNKEFE